MGQLKKGRLTTPEPPVQVYLEERLKKACIGVVVAVLLLLNAVWRASQGLGWGGGRRWRHLGKYPESSALMAVMILIMLVIIIVRALQCTRALRDIETGRVLARLLVLPRDDSSFLKKELKSPRGLCEVDIRLHDPARDMEGRDYTLYSGESVLRLQGQIRTQQERGETAMAVWFLEESGVIVKTVPVRRTSPRLRKKESIPR